MTIYFLYFLMPLLAVLTAMFLWHVFVVIPRETKPTLYAKPITLPAQITAGREKEIHRIARQILTGQSSAIIGAFSYDRNVILDALRSEEPTQRAQLYGDKADRLIFSWLDISALDINCTPSQFWEKALKPLEDKIADELDSAFLKAYQACQNNQFDNFYLDKLLVQLKLKDLRLILMLDRFETLLQHSHLDSSEFLGGLRTLASSRYPSPLSLIIAGDISLQQFHEDTKNLNPMGSPYLNFMESGEITLGALSESEIDELLKQSAHHFTEEEYRFIKEMVGGHPYLLQLATSVLWELHDNPAENSMKNAEKNFYTRVKGMLNNIVHSWQDKMRQAFLAVAQQRDVSGFQSELEILEKQGFVRKDNNGNWQVRARVFLDFVTGHDSI